MRRRCDPLKIFARACERRRRELLCQPGLLNDLSHGESKRARIRRSNEKTVLSVGNDFIHATTSGSDHRGPRQHGFHNDTPEWLRGDRTADDHIHRMKQLDHVGPESEKMHTPLQAGLFGRAA